MRKFLIITIVFCFFMCGISEAARRIVLPAEGICTGDNVRYRSGPGTRYKILGKLFKDDIVTVLSIETVGGQMWCEIYDPQNSRRTAWVSGQYIAVESVEIY